MNNKKRNRVVLYPMDLKPFCEGSPELANKLYEEIRDHVGLRESIPITTFHVRDYLKIDLEEVNKAIFPDHDKP